MSLLDTLREMRSRPSSDKVTRFILRYDPPTELPVTVGHLAFDGKRWTFHYDADYKQRSDLRPIEGFDEIEKVYQSSVLFPFFAVRIPDASRNDVRRTLDELRIRKPDSVDLLRVFGRRVVSSPAF